MSPKDNQPKITSFLDNSRGEMAPRDIGFIFPKKRINEMTETQSSRLFDYRSRIDCGEDIFFCPFCRASLAIRGGGDHFQLHLAHKNGTLNNSCPYFDTKKKPSREDILRAKFNGAKEGYTHKYLKSIIIQSFSDKVLDLSDIESEKRVTFEDKKWRKPDVHISFQGKEIVFEVQLVSTFVDVIAGRNMAYRDHGWYILWVLDSLEPEDMDEFFRRDIMAQNNNNVFALDEEALLQTVLSGELHLKVRYLNYHVNYDNQEIEAEPYTVLVKFSELIFDAETHMAYYKDCHSEYNEAEKELERYKEELEAEREAERVRQEEILRQELEKEREAERLRKEKEQEVKREQRRQYFINNYEEIISETRYNHNNDFEELLDYFIEDPSLDIGPVIKEIWELMEHSEYANDIIIRIINVFHKSSLIDNCNQEIVLLRSYAWSKLRDYNPDMLIPTIFDYCKLPSTTCDECLNILKNTDFNISKELYEDCVQYINGFDYKDEIITKATKATKEKDLLAFALIVFCIHAIDKEDYQWCNHDTLALLIKQYRVILNLMSVRTWKKYRCVACRNFPSIAGVANNIKSTHAEYSQLFLSAINKFNLDRKDCGFKHLQDLELKARTKEQNHDLDEIARILGLI